VVMGDRQGGYAMVRLRWVDAAKCRTLIGVPLGWGWERADIRIDVGGRGMVCGGLPVHRINRKYVDSTGRAGTGPGGERGHLGDQELQSIAIPYRGCMRLMIL